MMDQLEHEHLEEWAKNYGGTAILGFICTLLIGGKFLHHMFQKRGLVCGLLIIPPAMMSGVLGLIWFSVMNRIDSALAADLGAGLECVKGNLINFVFASLILGITCTRTTSHHTTLRGVVTSLLHEGMPMVIYSQILMWGQSTCCLFVLCVVNYFGAKIPKLFVAMVPLGIEAGADIIVKPLTDNTMFWSATVVEEAESLGLVVACLTGIVAISCKPFFVSRGWLGAKDGLNVLAQGSGQAEAFERATGSRIISVSASMPSLHADILGDKPLYAANKGDVDKPNLPVASLGAHLSLIALTVFLSFGVSLTARLVEIELNIEHRLVSGIRMFKLSMCCALGSMMFLLRRSKLKFNRDWFMRLCGLMLDLLFIAALSKAYPKPKNLEQTHYIICSCFVVICFLWNIFCFFFIARQVFPNFWFERGLVLTADCMGHSYTGLLFARTLDPAMESPVPAAYAYKLMLFFIPSSGGKNAAISVILARHGSWAAFTVSLFVLCTWYIIFNSHFRDQFVGNSKDDDFEEISPLIDSRNAPTQDEEFMNLHALSFDLEEEAFIPGGKCSDDAGDVRKSITAKGRKQANSGIESSKGLRMSASYQDVKSSKKFSVQMSEGSSIIKPEQVELIASWLPDCRSNRGWVLKYSLRRDGANLETLLSLCATIDRRGQPAHSSSVIIVQDSWGYVFGGYIGHALEKKAFYYGNGENFVFSVTGSSAPQCYKWTGKNDMYVISDFNCFAMGGGGGGFAFQLDDELDTGVSNRSDTYNNGQLSSSEFFKCLNLEVWLLDGIGFSV